MGILQSSEPTELPEPLRWNYEKFAAGIKGPFMIGAPPLAFDCHHPVKRTLPCLTRLKGCTLACPWCRYKLQFTTYLPVFDLSRHKKFKLVFCGGKKTWGDVKNLEPGTLVKLSRGSHEKDTLRAHAWPEPLMPAVLENWRRKIEDDISPYLFHLWQYRPLTEHFRQRYYPSLRVIANTTPHPDAVNDDEGNAIPE